MGWPALAVAGEMMLAAAMVAAIRPSIIIWCRLSVQGWQELVAL